MNIKELALNIRDAMGDEAEAFIMTNGDAIEFATRLFAARDAKAVPVFIVFDGPPSHQSPRFIEVETEDGKSVSAGEWSKVGEYWKLGPLFTHPAPVAVPERLNDCQRDILRQVAQDFISMKGTEQAFISEGWLPTLFEEFCAKANLQLPQAPKEEA